jgi:hypothetical protein
MIAIPAELEVQVPISWRYHVVGEQYEYVAELPHNFTIVYFHKNQQLCFALVKMWSDMSIEAMYCLKKEWN